MSSSASFKRNSFQLVDVYEQNYRKEHIVILSDSQAAFKAILFSQSARVHLIQVPGHKEVAGNELADELAHSAASTKMVGAQERDKRSQVHESFEYFCQLG